MNTEVNRNKRKKSQKGKWYAVHKGHLVGRFDNWPACQAATQGFPKAVFKAFDNIDDADAFVKYGHTNCSVRSSDDVIDLENVQLADLQRRSEAPSSCHLPVKRIVWLLVHAASRRALRWNGFTDAEPLVMPLLSDDQECPESLTSVLELAALQLTLDATLADALSLSHRNHDDVASAVVLRTDSPYLRTVLLHLREWRAAGWVKKSGDPPQNLQRLRDLAVLLDRLHDECHLSVVVRQFPSRPSEPDWSRRCFLLDFAARHGMSFIISSAESKDSGPLQPIGPWEVWTDGSCRKNGQSSASRPSGAGLWWGHAQDARNRHLPFPPHDPPDPRLDAQLAPTNQRAELYAILRAMDLFIDHLPTCPKLEDGTFAHRLVIHSDSAYSINALTSWLPSWKANQWIKPSDGQPPSNLDLFKALDQCLERLKSANLVPQLIHCRGHSGDFGNQQADRLARLGGALPSKANGH